MKLKDLLCEDTEAGSSAADHFITNIEKDTIENDNYRKVLFTSNHLQLVVMSIPPGESIGLETHKNVDQFIRVEKGNGKAVFNKKEKVISDGSAYIVPQGTEHDVINISDDEDLKIYTLYSPPNHQKDVIRKTKEDAKRNEEHFDGKTDVA